ncbi:MAG: beta-galactosidase trimerization domain-containing protein [Bacteroidota bacterium]
MVPAFPIAQDLPMLGAQVFIEPGQTEQQTEGLFKTLAEHGMNICRIRMFESYMIDEKGDWDFSLFDRAFQMAEKYDVKVMGTFFPATSKTDIGGWKFPKNDEQLNSFATYIQKTVQHFKTYKSLYAWVLINEPGGGLYDTAFSRSKRAIWDNENPEITQVENGYPILADLRDQAFERYMTSWMLNWIAQEVRKYDKDIHLHVNNHAIFSNAQAYDFPYWQTFLNSLGGSAHASWHFGLFERKAYAMAMAANAEIIRSGSGELPWLMTELQGGSNIYSGYNPMCPTPEEITQWLWLTVGAEGKGAIFWSLNPRASGIEAGGWALLDFQHQPTDRLLAVANVSKSIEKHKKIIAKAFKQDPKINLIYFKESFWTETIQTRNGVAATDGRNVGFKEILGYYKALLESGINANIAAYEEFDFSRDNYEGHTIVLANQVALPKASVSKLENFVTKGGKLIVSGLTGLFDENVHNVMLTGFPFQALFGGNISEIKYIDKVFPFPVNNTKQPLSGVLFKGIIAKKEGVTTLVNEDDVILGVRNQYGLGQVVWIPSLIGLGAWENSITPLADWLVTECKPDENNLFLFENPTEDVLMQTLQSPNGGLTTICINKSGKKQILPLRTSSKKNWKGTVLFANKTGGVEGTVLNIDNEETLVVHWE